jgi:hypothetical protein
MTPENLLRQYHQVAVTEPKLALNVVLNLTNYISGTPTAGRQQRDELAGRIAGGYFNTKNASVSDLKRMPQPFYIKTSKVFAPTEPFTYGSLQRAFAGRASPEEFSDVLRLAVAVGLCKPEGAAGYAKKWFGLDCNGFVGNWLGVSPSTSIHAYANGYGDGIPSGASADVLVTKDIIKLPPITDPAKIRRGSVLITYAPKGSEDGTNWKHIALVESITPQSGGRYSLTIAEWGEPGTFEQHMSRNKTITLTEDKTIKDPHRKSGEATFLPGIKTLAFWTTRKGKDALRFFLDSTKLDYLDSRGYEIGGLYGT